MRPISLEFASTFGLPPVEAVRLASQLGFQHISTPLQPARASVAGYERFSLREDIALRRALREAMAETGVTIASGEGVAVVPERDVRDLYAGDLAIMQELGIPCINVVSLDPDLARSFDQLAMLCELAGGFGIETLIEFVPIFPIRDLETALGAIAHVGRQDCRVMFDTMHFCRTGGRVADIAALDPDVIGYIQLCDVPAQPVLADYMEEAVCERMAPGEGDLPLAELFALLPKDRIVGLEVPQRSQELAGVSLEARLAHCLAAARRFV